MDLLQDGDARRALRVLRSLYLILREVHDDAIPRGLALRGRELRAAFEAGDRERAHAIATDVGEWLRCNRTLITGRIEMSFPALSGHPAGS